MISDFSSTLPLFFFIELIRAWRTINSTKAMALADWIPPGKYYTLTGEQQEWSQPTQITMEPVPYWHYLFVQVFVRDTWLPDRLPSYAYDDGWWLYCSYIVDSWDAILTTFTSFLHSQGIYHRVGFFVESWIWSPLDGWQSRDWL